jgi:hypothetical protein
MPKITKLARFEKQIDDLCSTSERIAVRLFLFGLVIVGLWTLARHLL